MEWLSSTIYWYIFLLLLGIICFPLSKRLFPRFFDYGYGFSKTIGIILLSYAAFFFGSFHLLPYTQYTLFGIILALGVLSYWVVRNDQSFKELIYGPWRNKVFFFVEEAIFLVALIFLAFVRGQEPSIHSLEKFMDFGFMNSILRSTHFPPLDMWYSAGPDLKGVDHPNGFPINYYYFGHFTGATLIKLTGVSAPVGYNLVLASILAQAATAAFSLIGNVVYLAQSMLKKNLPLSLKPAYIFGALGSFILNLGGNFHTIYAFTQGYTGDNPPPFWEKFSSYNPTHYWYPNATRFIPFTIHEFPSYSYVVADLHGHVFDIPFVLLTLAIIFHLFVSHFIPVMQKKEKPVTTKPHPKESLEKRTSIDSLVAIKTLLFSRTGITTLTLGFLTAVHFMTNVVDGPIYLFLSLVVLFLIYRFSRKFIFFACVLGVTFFLFSRPFAQNFIPFSSGIGVNCPAPFVIDLVHAQPTKQDANFLKWGVFLFNTNNCQNSPLWMLFTLWGFFWVNFLVLICIKTYEYLNDSPAENENTGFPFPSLDLFAIILFSLSTAMILFPEFFYIKDIYPTHFRANTMFKLGYQAFIMMSIASTYVLFRAKVFSSRYSGIALFLGSCIVVTFFIIMLIPYNGTSPLDPKISILYVPNVTTLYLLIIPLIILIFLIALYRSQPRAILSYIFVFILTHAVVLVSIYPLFSFPSYYGNLQKLFDPSAKHEDRISIDGSEWIQLYYPQHKEIIQYLNTQITGQPVILEAQGDSYTDYDLISAFTGLPTVAGWWVHEWLWRDSSEVVARRIPDIANIYESKDLALTQQLLKKYHVSYVVVTDLERKKYPQIDEQKFSLIGKKIFQSSNGIGALYQVK